MKKLLLLATAILPFALSGQTIILSDDFESYTAGELLAANSDLWTTWSGGIEAEDANVSNAQASSGSNSVYIIGNTGPTDLVLPFPSDFTSGIYELSMKMYIVAGKGAYFNLQQSAVPGINWMLEVYFDNAGGGNAIAGGVTVPVSYTPNTWTNIKTTVDLNNDVAVLYINSASVYTWQWSLGSTGAGAEKMWGGLDIFAYALNAGDAEFYVDDVVLTSLPVTGCPSPANLSVSMLSATNAIVQWDAALNAIGYKIVYHQLGVPTKFKKSSSSTTKKLSDLLPSTTYQWAVQTVCSTQPKVMSTFTMGPEFTTLPLKLGEDAAIPIDVEIFPNPVSENATISFSLWEESQVIIRLVDLNGKVVQEIENAILIQGSHQASFSSSQLSSGLYLLQVTTNDETVTKKLMIER